jgi:transcriptional regulator with XRE-family HTH domain
MIRKAPDTNLYQVATNIRNWRQIMSIKQGDLTDLLEISTVSMSKIETGKTDIPLKRLFSIAEALGIGVELLFSDPFSVINKNKNNHKVFLSPSNKIFLNSISEPNSSELNK